MKRHRRFTPIVAALLVPCVLLVLWLALAPGTEMPEEGLTRPNAARIGTDSSDVPLEPPMPQDSERVRTTEGNDPAEETAESADPDSPENADPDMDPRWLEPIAGQVLDEATLLPIPGARIFAKDPRFAEGERSVRAVSDANGCFDLDIIYWNARTITIQADGYAYDTRFPTDVWVFQSQGECGYKYLLRLGGLLSGRVVDQEGAPVTSGHVVAMPERWAKIRDPQERNAFSLEEYTGAYAFEIHARPRARIAEDGSFEIKTMPANAPMSLLVLSPSVEREYLETVEVPEGGRLDVVLVANRARVIAGVVIPPDGQSPDGYGFWICTHLRPEHHLGENPRKDAWVSANGDGTFRLGPIPVGKDVAVRLARRPAPGEDIPVPYDLFLTDAPWHISASELLSGRLIVDLKGGGPQYRVVDE